MSESPSPSEPIEASDASEASEPSAVATTTIESPPPAAQPARDPLPDPRARLHQLAQQLVRASNRRALIEFLRLRRALQ